MRSTDRVKTTHVGSLPRSEELLTMITKIENGEAVDREAFKAKAQAEIEAAISNQVSAGIDSIGDGEMPRLGFSIYAKDRLSGFGGFSDRGTVTDFEKFPKYAEFMAKRAGVDTITESATTWKMPQCIDALVYDDTQANEELDLYAAALSATKAAPSPNVCYSSHAPELYRPPCSGPLTIQCIRPMKTMSLRWQTN